MDEKVCSLIKDLKPMYMQKKTSNETEQYIKEHIKTCGDCRTYYEAMKSEAESKNQETQELTKLALRLRKRRRRIITAVAAGILVLLFIFTQVIQTQMVGSDSMSPKYEAGDTIMINRLAYTFSSPKRGDIVAYTHQEMSGIKRVIGLPGETVAILNGQVIIDGQILTASYLSEEAILAGTQKMPIVLGEDEYFVLGDNYANSLDSRDTSFGLIQRDEIFGRVLCKGFSLFKTSSTMSSQASAE